MTDTRVSRGRRVRCATAALAIALAAPAALAAALPPCGTAADEVRLQVHVSGIVSDKGNMTVTVYPDDADRFLSKGGKLARQRVPVVLPLTDACFSLPAPGHYAVAVYHDANDDHDFNRTFVGLPAEGYGFSNNPVTKIGLPSFKETRFAVKAGDNPLYIKLTY